MSMAWRVEMLGTFQATNGLGQTVSKFRTRRVALLLAYLAHHADRQHTRDEIADILWPESEPLVSRRNLRQALHSLRKVLEPPSVPPGSILQVQQSTVRLSSQNVSTDAAEMTVYAEKAREEPTNEGKLAYLRQAIALYKGNFLPGFYEPWIVAEGIRIEDFFLNLLRSAIPPCEALGRFDEAVQYLHLGVSREELNPYWHLALMRHYLDSDRPGPALRQFEEFERRCREELGAEPPDEAIELGERARSLIGTDLPKPTPEAHPLPSRSNLPSQATRFFGRHAETDSIREHLVSGKARLLTLLGPAGTGKTRLAIEVGRVLALETGWRVWFVPLADIDNPSLLYDRILESVKGQSPKDQLNRIRELIDKDQTLLILDNFEPIVDKAAALVGDIMAVAPRLRILVTSQQGLHIGGEHQFLLKPLPVPKPLSGKSIEAELQTLSDCPSVQMFLDRGQAVRPDLRIDKENAPLYAAICQKLEGVPLALEIAAGLSKSSTPAQILRQLDHRMLDLASRRRDIDSRHRSLRAAIDYSLQTLPPHLRSFFAQLSAFRGGFTAQSAFSVGYRWLQNNASLEDCYAAVGDLQERSLVHTDESHTNAPEPRYRLMDAFREYSEELLSPEEAESLKARHASYFLETCLHEDQTRDAHARAQIRGRIEVDYSNYIAALEYFSRLGKIHEVLRILTSLSTAWDVRGTRSNEKQLIRGLALRHEIQTVSAKEQIQFLRTLATTYLRDSDFNEAYATCCQALAVAETTGDSELIAQSYFGMSLCTGHLGQARRCIELCEKVLAYAPETNGVLLERTYVSIGSAYWGLDEFDQAREAFEKAQTISSDFRGGEPDPLILAHLSGLAIDQGRLEDAMRQAGEGIRISKKHQNDISLASCLIQVARYHWKKGNLGAAVAASYEPLPLAQNSGISALSHDALRMRALIATTTGEFETAATLLASGDAGTALETGTTRRDVLHAISHIKTKMTAADFETAWARGLAMNVDEAYELAMNPFSSYS